MKIADLMTPAVMVVSPETPARDVAIRMRDEEAERAAQVMAEHKVRRLPILNRDKRLVGVVAMADLARAGVEVTAIEGVSEPGQSPRAAKKHDASRRTSHE